MAKNSILDEYVFEKCVTGKTCLVYDKLQELKHISPEVCEKIFRENWNEKNHEAWRWYLENGKITTNFIREFQHDIDFRFLLSHNDYLTKELIWEFKNADWNWGDLTRRMDWTEDELLKIEDEIDWNQVVRYQKFSCEFLDNLIKNNKINTEEGWTRLSAQQKLKPWFIEKHITKIKWFYVLQNSKLKESFIEKHNEWYGYNEWCAICKYQKLSEPFMEKHLKNLDWDAVSAYQNLSEDFMTRHARKIGWGWVFDKKKLSVEFIEQNINRIKRNHNWFNISAKQDLTEDFMRKYDKYLYWDILSIQQKMGEQFVRDYFDHLDWGNVKLNKKNSFSPEFIKEMDELEIKTKPAWRINYILRQNNISKREWITSE